MAVTVYYERGQVVKISPEPNVSYYDVREIINEATSIVSDGIPYDLTDRNSIYSIAIPEYTYTHENKHAQDLGATGYLEYVLRMHAGLLWNNGNYDLSLVCLGKACQLMLYSPMIWKKKDYYRIVHENIELGRFKKAKEWKDWIEKYVIDSSDYAKDAFARTVQSCNQFGTDLVEVGDANCCCEICAKYRKRIYSLSGRNWKFPRFPKDFHFGCNLQITEFYEGVMEPSFKCLNYVLYSRRPFKDDRSIEEKERYKKRIEEIRIAEEKHLSADLNRIIYYWFKPKFPNDFPKSLSGFSRMRNSNSPKYQKLVQMIENAGYTIPKSLEEVVEIDEKNNAG